jgi:hypothetical protein
MRSPDDTPLRDGNRDRLMGLLTARATTTLMHTIQEDNPALHTWLLRYLEEKDIPKVRHAASAGTRQRRLPTPSSAR